MLFVHGFPFDGSMWTSQLSALPDGWRGLAPDLRGFGRSELNAVPGEVARGNRIGARIARPDEPVLTMARFADDLAELIEREVQGPAVICGLSMGGYAAFALWRRHPHLVRALVLADTRAGADDDEGRENRMRLAQVARQEGARAVAASMLPKLLAAQTRLHRPDVVQRVRTMIMGTRTETLVAALAGMACRHDSTAELPGIRVPTLVLVGEHDALTPPELAGDIVRQIAGARLVTIPGVGHLANLENPDGFNRALREFLVELD